MNFNAKTAQEYRVLFSRFVYMQTSLINHKHPHKHVIIICRQIMKYSVCV